MAMQSAGPGGLQMSTGASGQGLPTSAVQAGSIPTQMTTSPCKDVNTANFCLVGQQTVQEVVSKTQDVFKCLKDLQLPNGANVSTQLQLERKNKAEEQLKNVPDLFTRLRVVYNKVVEDTAYLDGESLQGILPVEDDEGRIQGAQPEMTDNVAYASQERQELIEQIQAKNRQLKDIIDKLRLVIWEINTMLDMRKELEENS